MNRSGRIFVIDHEGELRELRETEYEAEDILQTLIAKYPNLIPGDQIDPGTPRRWLLISREEGVPAQEDGGGRWSLDHLFLDQDAIPTLVEVKRSSDTRLRREVLGQMLDYAANAVAYWPIEQLQASFVRTCTDTNRDPGEVLGEFLGPEDPDAFWRSVKTNLQAGRIRMIFLADQIPSELARIVEFLNEQMDPAEVLAVEVPRYAGDGLQTLTPRVIGLTASARRRKSAGERLTRTWDAESFLDALASNCGPESRRVGRRIIEWTDSQGLGGWFGSGATNASFVPVLRAGGNSYVTFGLYMAGQVEIKFQYLQSWPPFDQHEMRAELLRRLNEIEGIGIASDRLESRPSFRVELLENEKALDEFLAAMEWCFQELREAVTE